MRIILNASKAVTVLLVFIFIVIGCKKDDPEPTPGPSPFNEVQGFTVDGNGAKILATDSGMFKLDDNGSYISQELSKDYTPTNDLKTFNYDNRNDLYISSNAGGLNYTTNEVYSAASSAIISDEVISIGMDLSNALFFGTPKGISIYDNEVWSLHTGREDFYLEHQITDMATSSKGHTFVTTSGGGVGRFELDVDGASGATVMNMDWTNIPSNNVNTVYIYDTIQIYGTDKGVGIHFSEFTKTGWIAYTIEDGLIANNVIATGRDNEGDYWFGTDAGLSKFDGEIWTSYTMETNGLLNNVIKFIAFDNDGAVWIATDDGVSVYSNEQWLNYPKVK